MSYQTEINVTGNRPDAARIAAALQEQNLNPVIGDGVVSLLKSHFMELDEERSGHFGGDGFYETAARSTSYQASGGRPAVVVTDPLGLRQRLLGGTITPKNAQYLAIPNYDFLDVTHGKSPREFSNLTILFGYQETGQIGPIGLISKQGGVFEARSGKRATRKERDDAGKKQGVGEGEVLFWLKKFVIQEPDATVIPAQDELETAGYEAAGRYLGIELASGYVPWNTPE